MFDGELDATDVFVSLISQKYGKTNTKEYLAKRKDMSYNEDEVQKSQIPSGSVSYTHLFHKIGAIIREKCLPGQPLRWYG